jgi:hypothetical protein
MIFDLLIAHGVKGEGEVRVYGDEFAFLKGREHFWFSDLDWTGVEDPEHLGRDLADALCDWLDMDEYETVSNAWENFEGDWRPEDDPEWWSEVERGFTDCANEILYEWRADRKYGHPSLTAAERNPGLR